MHFLLPSIKCSAAPPSFRLCCLNCTRRFDLITARSAVVGSWEEPPNIWLTVAKNAFVGWDLNFKLCQLCKFVTFLLPPSSWLLKLPIEGHERLFITPQRLQRKQYSLRKVDFLSHPLLILSSIGSNKIVDRSRRKTLTVFFRRSYEGSQWKEPSRWPWSVLFKLFISSFIREKCEKFSTLRFKRSDWPTRSFPISLRIPTLHGRYSLLSLDTCMDPGILILTKDLDFSTGCEARHSQIRNRAFS